MIKRIFLCYTICLVVCSFVGKNIHAQETDQLLSQSDLEYLGAFRVPPGDNGSPLYSGLNYGGTALAYNPRHNSLFIVGHNHHQLVTEISIVEPKISNSVTVLNTAEYLQPFTDITEDNRFNIGENGTYLNPSGVLIGGLLVWGDKLIGSVYGYYDATHTVKLSHFISGLDFSIPGDFQGMYQVGSTPDVPNPAFLDGYMGYIPEGWQKSFGGPVLSGNCCLSITGRTSLGPAAAVMDPAKLGIENPIPATMLVGYPLSHPTLGTYGDQDVNALFNGSMSVRGIVFPEGSSSVLFFGRRGTTAHCYGFGVSNPSLHNTYCNPDSPTVLCCYDLASGSKGGHAYPYKYQIFAYDAPDLLSVKNKQKEMWDIKPYGVWDLELPYAGDVVEINGAAYDPVSQKIYISQSMGERPGYSRLPVIHVFKINLPGASNYPADNGQQLLIRVSNQAKSNSQGSITVSLYTPGTSDLLYTISNQQTNSSGLASISSDIPQGNYDVLVKVPYYLPKKIANQNWPPDSTLNFGELKTGDLNNDNIINLSDLAIMLSNWQSNDSTSDLNKDGQVNSLDFSFINANWGRSSS